jgi:predicted phosphate transport protein (TIGR00153 family)
MKINHFLSVFAPKESKFFPLLEETADILVQTGNLLAELFSSTNKETIIELSKLVKAEETKGDKGTGRIFKELNNTFITPFDREDISDLADVMDDAIDAMNRAAHKVVLFSPEVLPQSTVQLAEIIKKGTGEIKAAVCELSNLKKNDQNIRMHAKEIKRLEEEADVVYEKGTSELFQSDIKAVELVKLKEIIQELEKSANRINSVGKSLKTIIVKYS